MWSESMGREAAIEVYGLGKRYELGQGRPRHDRITGHLVAALRRRPPREDLAAGTLWALRGLEFQVDRGETVGIVGRNGAGKSTLLKILSRITKPTEGTATLRGRVGSLLEVGTGFHPELTGRENVFLNGAILGMKRREVQTKLDEIIDFAGVERFTETPVKRYSSGMYMRLAFAVAAHLDTEILLVDEVLAVGDSDFRKKSIGKMHDAAAGGRTVVVVSHNMSSVSALCDRSLYLANGELIADGKTAEVLRKYLSDGVRRTQGSLPDPPLGSVVYYTTVETLGNEDSYQADFDWMEPIRVKFGLKLLATVPGLYLTMVLRADDGSLVLMTDDRDVGGEQQYEPGEYSFEIVIPGALLAAGSYFVTLGAASVHDGRLDHHDGVLEFTVHDHQRPRGDARLGVLGMNLPWRVGRVTG